MTHIRRSDGMGETLFLKFLGRSNTIIRVIDFLIDNEAFDYSKTEISKETRNQQNYSS